MNTIGICLRTTATRLKLLKPSSIRLYTQLRNAPRTKSTIVIAATGCLGTGILGWQHHDWFMPVHTAAPLQRPAVDEIKQKDKTVSVKEAPFDWLKFWKMLRPDLLILIAAVGSAIVVAITNIQIPILLGGIVNIVSSSFTNGLEGFSGDNPVDTDKAFYEIVSPNILKIIMIYCIQGAATFFYISSLAVVGERMAERMRLALFSSLLKQDIEFYDKEKTGEIINRLSADVQDFKSSFKMCISQGLRSFTQTIGCALSLYTISPQLTAYLLMTVPSVVVVGTLIGSLLRVISRKAQAQVAKSTGVADEAIGNIRTVRGFAMEDKELELYQKELEKSTNMNITLGVGIGMFQALSNVSLNGIVLGTLCLGGWLVSAKEMTPGDLMSFLVATQIIQRSLAQVTLLFGQFVRGMSAGSRVFEYINADPSIPLRGGTTIPYHTLRGEIEFSHVKFSYPTRPDQVVLKDFSLKIPAGKIVAIVGTSGGGKSTVAALLERFYEINSGSIKIDGVDIENFDPSWLRGRAIGLISQEPVLFATSIMENIRYGNPNATDTEVLEAAILANAHQFISQFPKGYRTVLGERGVTVSGGQKQRIAIARALIKQPSILIMDEATSALDSESEKIVQETLDTVAKGRTVLVIAHRLSTIRQADIIAVLAGGMIAEMGTHDGLVKLRGLYWDLIRSQEKIEFIKNLRFGG